MTVQLQKRNTFFASTGFASYSCIGHKWAPFAARNGRVRSAPSQPVCGPDELALRLSRRSSRLRAVHPVRSAVRRTGCRSTRLKGKIDLRSPSAQLRPDMPPRRRSDE